MTTIGTTVGVKGIWILEWLDRLALPTWKTGVLTLSTGALVGAVLASMVGEVNPESVLASYWTRQVLAATLFLKCMLAAMSMISNLAIARATEADLRLLLNVDEVVQDSIAALAPTRNVLLLSISALIIPATLYEPYIASLENDISLTAALAAFYGSGISLALNAYLLTPIIAAIFGMGFAIGFMQIFSLIHAARHVRIDLLDLNAYAAVANPGVRLILILLAVVSIFPPVMLYNDNPMFTAKLFDTALIMVLFLLPVVILCFYPVLILRNRIRDAKQRELEMVLSAQRGDTDAIQSFGLQGHDRPAASAYLLTHQMFIESRWEWPIAAHVQKLVLFGLLPPLTWVLAAAIENVMF